MEYKSVLTEFKAAGDKGEYEGHFSVFGNLDDGRDVAHPGMFAKTIQERAKRVKVFYAHDWMKLIGPSPEQLAEDSIGLFAKGRLTLDSFWGREAWALMKDNALNEGSFGYEAVKFDYEKLPEELIVRHLREVKLYEISPVPLGMNPLTAVNAVKSGLMGLDGSLELLAMATREIKEGRVLSTASKEKVQNAVGAMEGALDALNNLLAAAEPPKRGHSALLQRLRAAEAALSVISNHSQ
jgi:hypothetical protein